MLFDERVRPQTLTHLRDRKEANRFLFLEFWENEASRKAAGSQLPKEVMSAIIAAVGGPLKMADFDRLAG
jgi:quinol monooxygenase YgiN